MDFKKVKGLQNQINAGIVNNYDLYHKLGGQASREDFEDSFKQLNSINPVHSTFSESGLYQFAKVKSGLSENDWMVYYKDKGISCEIYEEYLNSLM